MTTRRCLVIPFLIGQRDDAIIGNSCADNPVWEVPCNPADLEGVSCVPGAAGAVDAVALGIPVDAAASLVLTAPPVKSVALS